MLTLRNRLVVIFLAIFLFINSISASPIKATKKLAHKQARTAPSCPAHLDRRTSHTFLGYNGFSGPQRSTRASSGGELGAVFYITDAVDLAKVFAHGPRRSEDTICLVYADAEAWNHVPKVWVKRHDHRGSAMNTKYPGAVLFDGHTSAGLPAASVHSVHQMGIRQAQIARLGISVKCYPKSCFDQDHHSLDYPSRKHLWKIQ